MKKPIEFSYNIFGDLINYPEYGYNDLTKVAFTEWGPRSGFSPLKVLDFYRGRSAAAFTVEVLVDKPWKATVFSSHLMDIVGAIKGNSTTHSLHWETAKRGSNFGLIIKDGT